MVFTHDTTMNPIQIILKSSQGTLKNSTKKSSLSFELNQNIVIPSNVDAYIMLRNFKFINCFYNINSTNNVFYYSVDSVIGLGIYDIHSFEIPIGNYNIVSLLAYLNNQLAGQIVIISSNQTFKFTFTSPDIFILRNGINSCLNIIGFNFVDTIQSYEITSPHLFNLSGVQMLYICITNLNISSIGSINSHLNNIIQDINITTLTGSTQSFENLGTLRYKVMNSLINQIDLDIYDENNQLVDFNNTDFFLNLSIIFSYKMQFKQETTLNLNGQSNETL